MKKFVFLYYGFKEPTPEGMDAWNKWFASVGDKVVDSGNPFGSGKEITKTGSKPLSQDENSTTGYSIFNAETIEEAEKIAQGCPATTIRVYEALPM
jgi:hypothetical protein